MVRDNLNIRIILIYMLIAAKIVCLDGALNRFKNFMTANAANSEKILRGPDYIIGDNDSIDSDSIDSKNMCNCNF